MNEFVITPSIWVEVCFDNSDPQTMLVVEKYNPDEDRWVKVYSPNEGTVRSVHYEQITRTLGGLVTPDVLDAIIRSKNDAI